VVVEYRRLDTPLKAVRRKIAAWLTGRPESSKVSFPRIIEDLNKCGLVLERRWYVSWLFSSSVLIQAVHHTTGRP